MNCTIKNVSVVGLLLGVMVFAINMTGLTNAFLYYASGMWVVDKLMQGQGEEAVILAFVFYFMACVLAMIFYCYVFCKIKSRLKQSG